MASAEAGREQRLLHDFGKGSSGFHRVPIRVHRVLGFRVTLVAMRARVFLTVASIVFAVFLAAIVVVVESG